MDCTVCGTLRWSWASDSVTDSDSVGFRSCFMAILKSINGKSMIVIKKVNESHIINKRKCNFVLIRCFFVTVFLWWDSFCTLLVSNPSRSLAHLYFQWRFDRYPKSEVPSAVCKNISFFR